MNRKIKTPQDSIVEMREMVMPNHTNPQNTIFGGMVMSWIDIAAAMCASRHCQMNVVTVCIDTITFKEPIKMGQHVHIIAKMIYAGTSSMEIEAKVYSEDPILGIKKLTTTAFLTFVGLDSNSKPAIVPELKVTTDDEILAYEQAKKRLDQRKKQKK